MQQAQVYIDGRGLRHWREAELSELPVRRGVRMRGMEMTRLETFVDAAFAFALTLLVISVDNIPDSYESFKEALRGIPAFVGSMLLLIMFWLGHRAWSRTYGMDDTTSVWLSVVLIAGVLVIVYPLKSVISAAMAFLTDGWAPAVFDVTYESLAMMFTVYGLSFFLLNGLIAVLYLHALHKRKALALNEMERYETREHLVSWSTLALSGLASAALANLLEGEWVPFAGWSYGLLGILMPVQAAWYRRRRPEPVNV